MSEVKGPEASDKGFLLVQVTIAVIMSTSRNNKVKLLVFIGLFF
jgi:hypothetical protein